MLNKHMSSKTSIFGLELKIWFTEAYLGRYL